MTQFKRISRGYFNCLQYKRCSTRWFNILLLTILCTSIYYVWKSTITEVVVIQSGCKHPRLELWEPHIRAHFKATTPIKCENETNWICVENGTASLCNSSLQQHPNARCVLTFLKRVSDQTPPIYGNKLKVSPNRTAKLTSDFFRVTCKDKKTKQAWQNIHAGIRLDLKIFQRAGWHRVPKDSMKLNVLIWGFDYLSRMTFIRKLPKSYQYLTKHLNALVLKDYNIVGDGTAQALIPILTGQTEQELPETRKRMGTNAAFVDIYPFVWNHFRNNGYVTAYAEDCPSMGTFTYRLKGFDKEPTDHYMRPFYQVAEMEHSKHPSLCLRGTPKHQVLMNWVKQFFTVYDQIPKFIFTFHSELSHDNYNNVGAADEDLTEMLQYLKGNNYLNNTLLIVMSDHGPRSASFRETQQGKQEERLPFFAFSFPQWFETTYPEGYKNFKINTERLTTPFDIYPTLKNVLHFNGVNMGDLKNRGISLFNEIPPNRMCADADIEPHWCACLDKQSLPNNDITVIAGAKESVKFINNLTEPHRYMCRNLKLKNVILAEMYIPAEGLLNFKKNADRDWFKSNLSGKTPISVKMYQLKLETEPGGGHYEVTLSYDVKAQTKKIKVRRSSNQGLIHDFRRVYTSRDRLPWQLHTRRHVGV